MPIGIDRFEDAAVTDLTTSDRILRFLFTHDDQAYTRTEIADAIGGTPETVGTNLTRLKDRGLVRHREPYWAITDDRERVLDALRDWFDDDRLAEFFDADTDEWASGPITTENRNRTVTEEPAGHAGARTEQAEPTPNDTDAREPPSPAPTSSEPHRAAATAFFDRIRKHCDEVIDALYLFGSVARDAETTGSDVDVLAVIADDADAAGVDEQLLAIAYEVQLEYEVPVEVHTMPASEFAARKDRGEPFIRTALKEGERSA